MIVLTYSRTIRGVTETKRSEFLSDDLDGAAFCYGTVVGRGRRGGYGPLTVEPPEARADLAKRAIALAEALRDDAVQARDWDDADHYIDEIARLRADVDANPTPRAESGTTASSGGVGAM